MKKILTLLSMAVFCTAETPSDAIVVSETKHTVTFTEVKTQEWRQYRFVADPNTGDIALHATYEEVVRTDGKLTSAVEIRSVTVPWHDVTNIAPALILVREQLRIALPTILTNSPLTP